MQEGKYKAKHNAVLKSIRRGKLTDQEIAEDNEVSVEFVQNVRFEVLNK